MKTSSSLHIPTTSSLASAAATRFFHHAVRAARTAIVALAALAFLSGPVARASDPIGIYALVDKVVFEPNETNPERIQIFGTFSLAKPGGRNDQYAAPQAGYLYYRLKATDKAVCLDEWADLKKTAGSGQAIAFGNRHQEKGRLRALEEKPATPDDYPVAYGLTKVRKSEYAPIKRLYEAAAKDSKPQAGSSQKEVPNKP